MAGRQKSIGGESSEGDAYNIRPSAVESEIFTITPMDEAPQKQLPHAWGTVPQADFGDENFEARIPKPVSPLQKPAFRQVPVPQVSKTAIRPISQNRSEKERNEIAAEYRKIGNASSSRSEPDSQYRSYNSMLEERPQTEVGVQVGITSWDWLSRLEQLLIHFFLIIFNSSSDFSKTLMEMFPIEASSQIEDIFRLLLQADPEMYRNLGYLVDMAEKWLVQWNSHTSKRKELLEFIRLYMVGCKHRNYYNVPIYVRLQRLGAFISGMRDLSRHEQASEEVRQNSPDLEITPPPVDKAEWLKRLPSPRVKPASHFARVVANILCDTPCERPLTAPDIYADRETKSMVPTNLGTESDLTRLADVRYGTRYQKRDLFFFPDPSTMPRDQERLRVDPCNRKCWLPIYSGSYFNLVQEEMAECCESEEEATKRKGGKGEKHKGDGEKGKKHKGKEAGDAWKWKAHRRLIGKYEVEYEYEYEKEPEYEYEYEYEPEYEYEYEYETERDELGNQILDSEGKPKFKFSSGGHLIPLVGPQGELVVKLNKDGTPMLQLGQDGKPILKTDEEGKPVYRLGSDGNPVVRVGSDGNPVVIMSPEGKPLLKRGSNGKPIIKRGSDGKIVYKKDMNGKDILKVGKDGNPVLKKGKDGNPILKAGPDGNAIPKIGKDGKPVYKLGPDGKRIQNLSLPTSESDDSLEGARNRKKKRAEYAELKAKLEREKAKAEKDKFRQDIEKTKDKKRKDKNEKDAEIKAEERRRKKEQPKDERSKTNFDAKGKAGQPISKDGKLIADTKNTSKGRPQAGVGVKTRGGKKPADLHGKGAAVGGNRNNKFAGSEKSRLERTKRDSDLGEYSGEEYDDELNGAKFGHMPNGRKPSKKSIVVGHMKFGPGKNRASFMPESSKLKSLAYGRQSSDKDHVLRKGQNQISGSGDHKVIVQSLTIKPGIKTFRKFAFRGEKFENPPPRRNPPVYKVAKERLHRLAQPKPKAKAALSLQRFPRAHTPRRYPERKSLYQYKYSAANAVCRPKLRCTKSDFSFQNAQAGGRIGYGGLGAEYRAHYMFHLPKPGQPPKKRPSHEFEPSQIKMGSIGRQSDSDFTKQNVCWETPDAFKKCIKANVIPLDNLISHIQKIFPRLKWPKGQPVAVRHYPNGTVFCATFKNGSGGVFYPSGGLAIAISNPSPVNHVIVIRDPSFDKFYFMDKAILADLDCSGKGSVFNPDGVVSMQYNTIGGFRLEGVDKTSQRWMWNPGGQRMILKLNRYMSLRILDLNQIHLVFNGNKRGVRFNVGHGRIINLMSVEPDTKFASSDQADKDKMIETLMEEDYFDYYTPGKFPAPTIGFFDNNRILAGGPETDADISPRCRLSSDFLYGNCSVSDSCLYACVN